MPFPVETAPAGLFEAASAIPSDFNPLHDVAIEMAAHEDEDAIWEEYAQADQAQDEFSHAAYTGGQ